MSKPVLRVISPWQVAFFCPGCKDEHWVVVAADAPTRWDFNGDMVRPTFSPSIKVMCGHHAPGFKPGDGCWCTFNADQLAKGLKPSRFECAVCHSFVRDGQIEFLPDCTHALAGQTVPLPAVAPDPERFEIPAFLHKR